ncbi:TonB-dependent receptor [Colwelliaceae bacterium BS250]
MGKQQVTKINSTRKPIAISIAFALGLSSLSAFAEEAATTADVDDEKFAIEHVTVTARHKVESLQTTPIAVSAFGADQIKEERITGLEDISSRVPGFQMNAYNSAEPELFMRGIGSDIESAGSAAAIGMYIDGVYISRGTSAVMDLYDLQSVEVLRGPQGTLYGKNVVGGAVNFITKRPVDGDMEGSAEVTVGDYGLLEAKGYVTGAISESVAGKISVVSKTRDGYGKNTYTGNDADVAESTSIRGQLLYTASDDLEMLFTAAHSAADGVPKIKHIGYSAGRNEAFISDNEREDLSSIDNDEESNSSTFSLQVDYDTSIGHLTSITAYRDNDYRIYENAAAGLVDSTYFYDPYAWGPCEDTSYRTCIDSSEELAMLQVDDEWLSLKAEESNQFSQEFRLAGGGDKFSWLAGAFYMKEDIERNEAVDYWFHGTWGTIAGNGDTPWEASDENWNTIGSFDDGTLGNTTNNETTSYAIFGNGTYQITEKLSVTAGLRWSKDEKDFSGTAYGRRFDNGTNMHVDLDGNDVFDYAFETSDSWDEWTPSFNLDYQATDDMFLYVSASKGYKAGGFNGEGMEKAEEAVIAFAPETAWNYEAGFKTRSFADRLQVNGALFFTEYTDIQTTVWVETGENTPDNLQVFNGTGEVSGLELEVVALVSEGLTVTGSYGFIDSEFTEDFEVDGDNLKGNKMRRTPENTFSLNARYEWGMGDLGEASVSVSYQYQDEYFFDNSNDPLTQVDSESNVDAAFMLRSFEDTWSVQVWAKNLTDELNLASTTVYAAYDDTVFNSYKAPRTVGVTFGYNF